MLQLQAVGSSRDEGRGRASREVRCTLRGSADMSATIVDPARMTDATKRRFNRTHISRRDFAKSIDFIAAATKYELNSPEYEGLLLAAIICYARPFSGNEQ